MNENMTPEMDAAFRRVLAEYARREALRRERSVANRALLARLTTEDHAAIERLIRESGCSLPDREYR